MWLALSLAVAAPPEPPPPLHQDVPVDLAQVAVVNVWASWCGPCLEELPLLDELDQRLAPEARILAVSVDRRPGPARAVAERLELQLPLGLDAEGAWVARYAPEALPMTFLVDGQGEVLQAWSGELHADDVAELEARVLATAGSR